MQVNSRNSPEARAFLFSGHVGWEEVDFGTDTLIRLRQEIVSRVADTIMERLGPAVEAAMKEAFKEQSVEPA